MSSSAPSIFIVFYLCIHSVPDPPCISETKQTSPGSTLHRFYSLTLKRRLIRQDNYKKMVHQPTLMLRVGPAEPAHALLRPKGHKFAYCWMSRMQVHPQNGAAHIRLFFCFRCVSVGQSCLTPAARLEKVLTG